MKKERNPNIELWRCFCMFAVVLGHVLVNNGIGSMKEFLWHIPGFLLITGYFGTTFSLRKIMRLIVITYACYWLTIPFRWGQDSLIQLLLPHGGWFLPFYCVLLLMSPLLNAALKQEKDVPLVLMSVIVMVCIGWLPTFGMSSRLSMLNIPGMQGNGLLLMIATYVAGACLRALDVAERLSFGSWAFLFALGVAGCSVMGMFFPSACHFLSPVSISTAACGFMAFIRMPRIPDGMAKVVTFIAPSMFGVYLLHEMGLRKLQFVVGGGALPPLLSTRFYCLPCVWLLI